MAGETHYDTADDQNNDHDYSQSEDEHHHDEPRSLMYGGRVWLLEGTWEGEGRERVGREDGENNSGLTIIVYL